MIYLDNGATSFFKPRQVYRAVAQAMQTCANPGRGGHSAALRAAQQVYGCRETAAKFFDCQPEQVIFTPGCTQALNIAIGSLVKPGDRVVISGFEHNAVTRTLHGLGAEILVAGRTLFDWEDCLTSFEIQLRKKPKAAVFTHVSNVFGYILPVEELAGLCRKYEVPYILDAAQSAGTLPVQLQKLGAAFIAMPGHKGLLGPQGIGLLLCGRDAAPLVYGGTGSASASQQMPDFLPDSLEAGTLNVPGIAGVQAGLEYLKRVGLQTVFAREHTQLVRCADGLKKRGMQVFSGPHQAGTLSFVPGMDCEEAAAELGRQGIAVRAGLHCAPYAHESAGTLPTGTVRVSFGMDANHAQTEAFLQAVSKLPPVKT